MAALSTPRFLIPPGPTIRNENSIETVLPELNNNKNHRWGVNWSRHKKNLFAGKITKDDKINVTSKVGKKSECVKIRGVMKMEKNPWKKYPQNN